MTLSIILTSHVNPSIFNHMVEYTFNEQEANLDRVFHALADSTRRSMLNRLKEDEYRVTELASLYKVSLNAISKHLKVLENAQLIDRNIQGRVHLCKTNSDKLKDIELWMTPYKKFWKSSLDNLEKYLVSKKNKGEQGDK